MKQLAIALVASLVFGGASASPEAFAAPAPSATASPAATVHIRNFAYHGDKVTVHVGDTVLFVNDDDDAHTVTATDKSFDSGGLDTKDTWLHTFTKPGTYTYFCALHPYMKAVVVVLAAAQQGGTP